MVVSENLGRIEDRLVMTRIDSCPSPFFLSLFFDTAGCGSQVKVPINHMSSASTNEAAPKGFFGRCKSGRNPREEGFGDVDNAGKLEMVRGALCLRA